jgi:hypothetical protein
MPWPVCRAGPTGQRLKPMSPQPVIVPSRGTPSAGVLAHRALTTPSGSDSLPRRPILRPGPGGPRSRQGLRTKSHFVPQLGKERLGVALPVPGTADLETQRLPGKSKYLKGKGRQRWKARSVLGSENTTSTLEIPPFHKPGPLTLWS